MLQVLPITLSGLGVREGALVLFLHPFGVHRRRQAHRGGPPLVRLRCVLVSMLGAPRSRSATASTKTRRSESRSEHRPSSPRPTCGGCPAARALSDGHVLYWWVEILVILGFYVVYSAIRNMNGGSCEPHRHTHSTTRTQIIELEQRRSASYHEQTFQDWAQHFTPLIIAANYFYGSLHFIVTICAGIFLFRRCSDDYPRFRNTLGDHHRARAHRVHALPAHAAAPAALSPDYGFVDTLAKYPTFWSFNSGGDERDLEPVRGDAERAHRVGRRGARSRSFLGVKSVGRRILARRCTRSSRSS